MQILFRGKRKDNKAWAYGGCYEGGSQTYIVAKEDGIPTFHEIEPYTLGRFTGVYAGDKPVYEGDLISRGGSLPSPVVFQGNLLYFGILSCDVEGSRPKVYSHEDVSDLWTRIEVTGNIYDNPYESDSRMQDWLIEHDYLPDTGQKSWNLDREGHLTIIGDYLYNCCPWKDFRSEIRTVEIKDATVVPKGAFSGCSNLTSIHISSGVKTLGDWAFTGCTALGSIEIPNTVERIGWNAFRGCTFLTNITLHEGLRKIEAGAFAECLQLADVYLPRGITHLGAYMVEKCERVTVHMPDSYASVPSGMFSQCLMTKVDIPSSVEHIGNAAFSDCKKLKEVKIRGALRTIGEGAFVRCRSLEELMLPDSVERIGDSAFHKCSSLHRIYIPEHVSRIGRDAFDECHNLVIQCKRHSFAYDYARGNNIPVEII